LFNINAENSFLTETEFKKLVPISILHLSNGDFLNNGFWDVIFNCESILDINSGSDGKFGTVGAVSYGACGVMANLAEAFWGLLPWNVMFDEDYYDGKLLKGIERPNTILILNREDRLKYRREKFGIN